MRAEGSRDSRKEGEEDSIETDEGGDTIESKEEDEVETKDVEKHLERKAMI